jgi:hypothetical protein
MDYRRIELVCGALGGVLGFVVLGLVLFAPLNMICSAGTEPSIRGGCVRMSGVQSQGLANLWLPVLLFAVPFFGVILFAVWRSRSRSMTSLVVLWVCAVAVSVLSVLALTSIGVYFIPADLLSLAAAIVGTVAAQRRVPAQV